MKAIRPLSLGVCLSALPALFSGCATQPHPEPLTITVPRVKGAVQFSSNGQTWHPLKKGSECKVGVTFQTPVASFADIAFDKKPEPHLNPNAPSYAPESPRYCPIRIMEKSTLKVEKAVKCSHSSWKH